MIRNVATLEGEKASRSRAQCPPGVEAGRRGIMDALAFSGACARGRFLRGGCTVEIAQRLREAVGHQQAGRLAEAEAALRRAVGIAPRHVDALSNLGATLQRQGKLTEALPVLYEALRLAPRDAQVHNDLGGTLLAAGHPDRAERHLREAIRLR